MKDRMPSRPSPLQRLRNYLSDGGFGPNDQLPPERQLAEQLDITRSKLRTSLARLEKEGVIWRHVGQGTFIRGQNGIPPIVPQPAQGELETNPSEILEARLAIEPHIASLAAQRATGSDLDRIAAILEKSGSELAWDNWSSLDKAFHLAIAEASKNQLLLKILSTIQECQTPRNWGRLSEHPVTMARQGVITTEHQEIFRAIQSREPQAASNMMMQHLNEVRNALLGSIGQG